MSDTLSSSFLNSQWSGISDSLDRLVFAFLLVFDTVTAHLPSLLTDIPEKGAIQKIDQLYVQQTLHFLFKVHFTFDVKDP